MYKDIFVENPFIILCFAFCKRMLYIFLCTPNVKKIVLVLSTASTALVVVCECIRCHLDLLHLACSSEYAPEMSHNFYISRMACYCLRCKIKIDWLRSLNYIPIHWITIIKIWRCDSLQFMSIVSVSVSLGTGDLHFFKI